MEVEAKFSIPDESAFQCLLEATSLGEFDLHEVSAAELHDTYLDTENGAVHAAGYAYRLRRRGQGYLATLKGLGGAEGGIHRRVEQEVELAAPLSPQDWPPSAARDLVLQLSGGEPLHALFTIEQTRLSRLVSKGGCSLAELSLDRVSVCQGDAVAGEYLELEVELLPEGTERDLTDLAAALLGKWGLAPEPRSKYERALAFLGGKMSAKPDGEDNMATHRAAHRAGSSASRPARRSELAVEDGQSSPGSAGRNGVKESSAQARLGLVEEQPPPSLGASLLEEPGITPDDPMSEAGRKTLRFHYLRMLANEPGTRLGEDVEALHDMRVATRRSRAAFRVFGAYFEPDVVAPYLRGLKRTGRALGAVRDLDVFRAKTQVYVDALPESQREGLEGFLAALEHRREEARAQMIGYLDSNKYRRFVRRFGEFVETEGMGSLPVMPREGEPQPYRVRHVAPLAIHQRLAAVRAYEEWVSIPNPPLSRLHALRIACKRLRYTLEFFKEVLGAGTERLIKEVVALQDLLGALQDTVVAGPILREYLARGTFGENVLDAGVPEQHGPIDAPGVAGYLQAQQEEQERLLAAFPEAWGRLERKEFRRTLAEVIAIL